MRDLRLALPVALAWAVLAALSPHVAMLGPAAAGCALVAGACLLGARGAAARHDHVAAALSTAAVGAGLAVPLLAGAASATSVPLDACDTVSLLVLGASTPAEVLVTGCDGAAAASIPPSALLLRADAPLAIGATALGACDAWLDGSRWLLACARLDVAEPAAWAAWASPLRDGLLTASAQLPGAGGQLLPGLAIGDERRIGPALEAAMLGAGLSHLTAVSGANCVIVVGAAFHAAAALGARRGVRVAIAAGALAGFVLLVTPEPSVVRAGTMAGIALIGLITGRRVGALALLALAVLLALAAQPHLATSAGFALSVLATCGLIVHARPIAIVLGRVLPMPVAALIAVPAAAQLWCMPVLVALDASVSLVAVLANLLAGPAAPLATVLGLAACVAAPLVTGVAAALAWIAWLPAAWIAQVAMLAQQLPASQTAWPAAPWGVVAASVMLAAVVLGHARRHVMRGVAVASAVGLVAAGVAAWPAVRLGSLADWTIAQCDVGQGSATVVRHAGATVLIDAGREAEPIDRCLRMLGVGRIELLVLTHFDVDHAGGAPALAGRIGTLVHGPVDERAAPLVAELVAAGATAQEARRGDAWMLGELRVDALWPTGDDEPGNDASVAVAIDVPDAAGAEDGEGALELVVLGDLSADAQSRLLRAGVPGPASVIVVAHHGSADQLPALYRRLGAAVGLIGVGPNDYGHPADAALQLVRETGGAPLGTDELGTIALAVDDDGVRVWSERVGGPP